MSLGLFQEVPLDIWRPTPEDVSVLETWLLETNMDSAANQLGRLIISNMNWGLDSSRGSSGLFLPLDLHRQMALLLIQTFMKHLTNKNVVGYFTVGMKQVSIAILFCKQ